MTAPKIKITNDNAEEIGIALLAVHTRSSLNIFSARDVIKLTELAEAKVIALVGSSEGAVGARIEALSGHRAAVEYKYYRAATRITIVREADGWFLIQIEPESVYRQSGKVNLILSESQRQLAAIAAK